jgi:hypothetical protein
MICVHLLPSVLICVEEQGTKNPAVDHSRVLKLKWRIEVVMSRLAAIAH